MKRKTRKTLKEKIEKIKSIKKRIIINVKAYHSVFPTKIIEEMGLKKLIRHTHPLDRFDFLNELKNEISINNTEQFNQKF